MVWRLAVPTLEMNQATANHVDLTSKLKALSTEALAHISLKVEQELETKKKALEIVPDSASCPTTGKRPEYFCKECKKLVCGVCATKCRGHTLVGLPEYATKKMLVKNDCKLTRLALLHSRRRYHNILNKLDKINKRLLELETLMNTKNQERQDAANRKKQDEFLITSSVKTLTKVKGEVSSTNLRDYLGKVLLNLEFNMDLNGELNVIDTTLNRVQKKITMLEHRRAALMGEVGFLALVLSINIDEELEPFSNILITIVVREYKIDRKNRRSTTNIKSMEPMYYKIKDVHDKLKGSKMEALEDHTYMSKLKIIDGIDIPAGYVCTSVSRSGHMLLRDYIPQCNKTFFLFVNILTGKTFSYAPMQDEKVGVLVDGCALIFGRGAVPLLVDIDQMFEDDEDNFAAWESNIKAVDFPRVICPEQTRRIHFVDDRGFLCELVLETRGVTRFNIRPVHGSILEVSQRSTRIKCIYSVMIIYDAEGRRVDGEQGESGSSGSDGGSNSSREEEEEEEEEGETETETVQESGEGGEEEEEEENSSRAQTECASSHGNSTSSSSRSGGEEGDTQSSSSGEYDESYMGLIAPGTEAHSYNIVALTYDNTEVILGSTAGLLQNLAFVPSQSEPSEVAKGVILCRGCYITDQTIHLVDTSDEMFHHMADVSLWFKSPKHTHMLHRGSSGYGGHREPWEAEEMGGSIELETLSSYTMTEPTEGDGLSSHGGDNMDVPPAAECLFLTSPCDTDDIDLAPCEISRCNIFMVTKDRRLGLVRLSKK